MKSAEPQNSNGKSNPRLGYVQAIVRIATRPKRDRICVTCAILVPGSSSASHTGFAFGILPFYWRSLESVPCPIGCDRGSPSLPTRSSAKVYLALVAGKLWSEWRVNRAAGA